MIILRSTVELSKDGSPLKPRCSQSVGHYITDPFHDRLGSDTLPEIRIVVAYCGFHGDLREGGEGGRKGREEREGGRGGRRGREGGEGGKEGGRKEGREEGREGEREEEGREGGGEGGREGGREGGGEGGREEGGGREGRTDGLPNSHNPQQITDRCDITSRPVRLYIRPLDSRSATVRLTISTLISQSHSEDLISHDLLPLTDLYSLTTGGFNPFLKLESQIVTIWHLP